MPITELENGSESVWVKVFANKTLHFVASWYRPPDSKVDELELFKKEKKNLKRLKRYIMEPPPPLSPRTWVISTSEILFGQIDSINKVLH